MPLHCFPRKLAHINATGGGGNHSSKHTYVTSLWRQSFMSLLKPPHMKMQQLLRSHLQLHTLMYRQQFTVRPSTLPAPRPTHAITDGTQKQAPTCTRGWGAAHTSAPQYCMRQLSARNPPYQTEGDPREIPSHPLYRKHKHTWQLGLNNLCAGIQTLDHNS